LFIRRKRRGIYPNEIKAYIIITELEALLPLMKKVYDITYRKQILGESVPNDQKLFSIYELHTDIIV
jgi:IS5 family transposase